MNTTTHNPERLVSLPSLVKQHISQFINENPEVFEALSRAGSPFGGSWRADGLTPTPPPDPRVELAQLRQQLHALSVQVVQLTNQLQQVQAAANESASRPARSIGINRFRALQAAGPSMV